MGQNEIRFLGRIFNGNQSVASDTTVRPTFPGPYQIGYAYAPVIVKWNGKYHLFCCAADYGLHGVGGGDLTRHSSSDDGIQWSDPQIVLYPYYGSYPPGPIVCSDCCCCDPSVVLFQGHWYLFYSGCPTQFGTAMYVARSDHIEGPYEKYTLRQTWESNPADPAIIIQPTNPTDGYYGAGQQTVVVRDNNLLCWFTDTTLHAPNQQINSIRFVTSDDAVTWSSPVTVKDFDGTDLDAASIDVKFDESNGQYVLFDLWGIEPPSSSTQLKMVLRRRYSSDGIQWSQPEILVNEPEFPNFAHNPGVSGDERGFLLPDGTIVAFAASKVGQNVDDVFSYTSPQWGSWDTYACYIERTLKYTFARVRAAVNTWQEGRTLLPHHTYSIRPRTSDRWTLDSGSHFVDFHGSGQMDGSQIGIPKNPIPLGGLIVLVYHYQSSAGPIPQIIDFPAGIDSVNVTVGPQGADVFFMISDLAGSYGDNFGDCVIAVNG